MKATGNGQTIVIFDSGEHLATITATARRYAPGAIVEPRQCGVGASIDYQAIKRELRAIAANPGRINIIQFSWGLPNWIAETIPPWASDPEKGMEQELAALTAKGIYVVVAAGDDSQGGKLGANYPACSPHCIPAMGSAPFCNRTKRGLVCQEDSASRAASELSAAIAVIQSAGGNYETLEATADGGTFETLRLDKALASIGAEFHTPAIEKHRWLPLESGRLEISVTPETKITRYKSDGKTIHRERFGLLTTVVYAGQEATIGVSGGLAKFAVTMRRAA